MKSKLGIDLKAAVEKEKQLDERLKSYESALIAFSGGADSAYLLFRALGALGRTGVLAVTVVSELTPTGEVEEAAALAGRIKVRHLVLPVDVLKVPEIKANSKRRCYVCKRMIYGKLLSLADVRGFSAVLDGSNYDDRSVYRPGLQALRELEISSPLLEACLTKEEIRELSARAGLSTWDKPAAACLASRFPYGVELNAEKLQKVAAAERFLQQLGVRHELRVRCHGDLARIEVGEAGRDLLITRRQEVVKKLRSLGFLHVTLDLGGFQSGSMDRASNRP